MMLVDTSDMTQGNCYNYIASTPAGTHAHAYGIYEKTGGELIGFVSITGIHPTNRAAHIKAVAITPLKWNEGYITETAELIASLLFLDKNIRRVSGNSLAGNDASEYIYKKLGFKHEGTERKAVFKSGSFVSRKNWGILKKEFDWSLFEDNKESEDG